MPTFNVTNSDLAHKLTQFLAGWTALDDSDGREALLLRAGISGPRLRGLPYDAPLASFAPILAWQLVTAIGTDAENVADVGALLAFRADVDTDDIQQALAERGHEPQVEEAQGRPREESSPTVQTYLEALVATLGTVDTTFLGPSAPERVTIDQFYVPLPTAGALRAAVGEDGSIEWSIAGIRSSQAEMLAGGAGTAPSVPRLAQALEQVSSAVGAEPGALPGETTRPLVLRPLANGDPFEVDALRVEEVVAQFKRVLLTGGPGAGKSTAARYLAVILANDHLGASRDGGLLAGQVPVFIGVNALTRWEGFVDQARNDGADVITLYVSETSFGGDFGREQELRGLADDGQLLLVVDGLDEVWIGTDDGELGIDRRALLAAALDRFLRRYPNAGSLITCRPEAEGRFLPTLNERGFSSVELPPVGTDYAELLVERFLDLCGAQRPDEVKMRIRSLWSDGVEAVLSVPLYVALFAATLTADVGPAQMSRSALLGEAVRLLAIRWSQSRSATELHGDPDAVIDRPEAEAQLIAALQRIALKSLTEARRPGSSPSGIDNGALLGELTYFRNGMYLAFTYLVDESGLFEAIDEGLYRFRLRPFEEYLGAAELISEGGRPLEEFKGAMKARPERWLEPVALACDLLAGRLGAVPAAAALGDVILDWLNAEDEQEWAFLWLASTAVERLVDDHSLATTSGTCNRLVARVEEGYPGSRAISHFGRLRVGEAIAKVGDPRVGVTAPSGIPEFDWLDIPGGVLALGTSAADEKFLREATWSQQWNLNYEQQASDTAVGAYSVSRYLVTVGQYRAFLDAENGYASARWWDGLAVPLTAPELPRAAGRMSDPATDVSWYDALAFCRWASACLGEVVRLPTEVEWEFAARGPSGVERRVFPWGDVYDDRRANGLDSGIGRPTPVGLYPVADGAWGNDSPLDLSGNVWEWCSTIHSTEYGHEFLYPYNAEDGRESLDADDSHRRVVRGGSFTNQAFLLRTTMRGHDRPSLRAARQGFRVVKGVRRSDGS